MKNTGLFSFVVIVIGAILLAACGQATTPAVNSNAPAVASLIPVAPAATALPASTVASSSALAPDKCTLLSKDEVGTILTEPVADLREEGKGTLCVYQTQKLIFELSFLNTGGMSATQYMDNVRATKTDSVPVPGLGDDAFNNASPAYPILFVRKGDSVYTFGLRNVTADQSLSSPENAQATEKTLAALLLTRLP